MTAPALVCPPAELGALDLYDQALIRAASGTAGQLVLRDATGRETRVDAVDWCRDHRPGDTGLLDRCSGATLDVGCGPGRLTGALLLRGRAALGVDVSAVAVRMARARGASALRRDVFAPLPGHGRWQHLLLADGNLGIGGDPVALLRRCRELIARRGQVHAEVEPPGTGSWAGVATLHAASLGSGTDGVGAPLRWARVAADDLESLARTAGLRIRAAWNEEGRWFATLTAA
ncbi:methyltransferase domain-containing protein [Actinoplanes palleronii]|uniref:Methyltransferase type 12 n=1 Tax=Actinoplanes palleronii TaxID=113570 RepID=A0ABQ4BSM9_9ACTN|nr:class I SAM-dependent methyltransferase [Actinoplanes palleronii]GIE73650.1 methyltransferase type 12 [Actinoplanes palleronii]